MGHVTLHSRVTSTASCYIPFHPQHQDAAATTLHHVHRGPQTQRHDPRMQRHEGEASGDENATITRVGMGCHAHPHKRFIFFWLLHFIYVLTPSLPSPAISLPPMRHSTTQTRKMRQWGAFFVSNSCLPI